MTLSFAVQHRQGAFSLDADFRSDGRLTALFGPSARSKVERHGMLWQDGGGSWLQVVLLAGDRTHASSLAAFRGAGGRIGRADLGARLLSTDDPAEARAIARRPVSALSSELLPTFERPQNAISGTVGSGRNLS